MSEHNVTELQIVDMKWLTKTLKMTDKWIYKMIQQEKFVKPIKLGRCSRWRLGEIKQWLEDKE